MVAIYNGKTSKENRELSQNRCKRKNIANKGNKWTETDLKNKQTLRKNHPLNERSFKKLELDKD